MQPTRPPTPVSYRGVRWRGVRRRHRLLVLMLLIMALLAWYAGTAPWTMHIGGKFTPLAMWDGYGPVRASNGGRYVLFAHLQGGVLSRHARPCDSLRSCNRFRGTAKLCGHSGKTYTFDLSGTVHSWWSTNGASTLVEFSNHPGAGNPLPTGWVVTFRGNWDGPTLPLATPNGSFTEVFTRDGAARRTASAADDGTANVTLRPGTAAAFAAACRSLGMGRLLAAGL